MALGAELLNQPPPSPVNSGQPDPQGASVASLAGTAGMPPQAPQAQPQELFALGEQITNSLLSFASAAPMIGADVAQVVEHWKTVLAKYMQQVASGATAPSVTGPQYPGGGFTSGASALFPSQSGQ